MLIDDSNRIGQRLFAARDRGFVGSAAGELDRYSVERHFGRGRRDGAGQEEEPFQRVSATGGSCRPEPASLLAEIRKYRVRFPQRQVAVDEYRNATVWIQRQEFGQALFAFEEINCN